MVRLRM